MSMITKYFTSVKVRFDPFSPSSRPARLFLSRLPSHTKVDLKVLPRDSTEEAFLEVTYKDKKVLKGDLNKMNIADLGQHFNSHSRKLAIEDAIKD
jgi:large subunit ribosomal protein L53